MAGLRAELGRCGLRHGPQHQHHPSSVTCQRTCCFIGNRRLQFYLTNMADVMLKASQEALEAEAEREMGGGMGRSISTHVPGQLGSASTWRTSSAAT